MGLWLVHTVVFTVHANLLLAVCDSDQEILDFLCQKLLLHVPFKINNTHIKLNSMHAFVTEFSTHQGSHVTNSWSSN